ncbi:MAG: hypothetical protein L0154_03605 [Chloroflexi bacterium]|nr:hypothetical protein [Chloroflexota bacterium]
MIIKILQLLLGLALIILPIAKWEVISNSRRGSAVSTILGDIGARIFYMIIGAAIVAAALFA